jgi:bacteriocin-like protein
MNKKPEAQKPEAETIAPETAEAELREDELKTISGGTGGYTFSFNASKNANNGEG